MNAIKSVNDLPEWFRQRKYKKQLNVADWYRSIRWRQKRVSSYGDFLKDRACFQSVSKERREKALESIIYEWDRDAYLYNIEQINYPVQPVSRFEALYLAALTDPESRKIGKDLESLIDAWSDDQHRKQGRLFPMGYEAKLYKLLDESEELPQLEMPAYPEDEEEDIGNPFLSCGRPLAGYPLTVDLQFDDETILLSFKQWLTEQRERQGVKLRKPIGQSDFDDWVYYRIREIFDLDQWSAMAGVKILDNVIANALWPNAPDGISPIDILRTTARKKVKEVFNFEFCVRFHGQLVLEKGENFLLE